MLFLSCHFSESTFFKAFYRKAWLGFPVKATFSNCVCEPGHLQSCSHVFYVKVKIKQSARVYSAIMSHGIFSYKIVTVSKKKPCKLAMQILREIVVLDFQIRIHWKEKLSVMQSEINQTISYE